MKIRLLGSGLAIIALWAAAPAGAVSYSITDLGEFGGRLRLNNVGQVIGSEGTFNFSINSFLYDGSTKTVLSPAGGNRIELNAIADSGAIVGRVLTSTTVHGFVRAPDGTMTDLTPSASVYSIAQEINASGQIVGSVATLTNQGVFGPTSVALWSGGALTDLGTFGGTSAQAVGINDAGTIIAYKVFNGSSIRAIVYQNGTGLELAGFGGYQTYAVDINAAGAVIGFGHTADNNEIKSFVYVGGVLTDIGNIGGYLTTANAINDSGVIVGTDFKQGVGERAFFYDPNAGMTDLNSLIDPSSGWRLTRAQDINNHGQIVGIGTLNGRQRAYLLTALPGPSAVPEPGSWALLMLGFALTGTVARRRISPAVTAV